MKLGRDFVLEMCGLDEDDEAGMMRLTYLNDLWQQLFHFYGLMGDDLGDYALKRDLEAIDIFEGFAMDDATIYPVIYYRNEALLSYLDSQRLARGLPADEAVAAAGGAAAVYDGALAWTAQRAAAAADAM